MRVRGAPRYPRRSRRTRASGCTCHRSRGETSLPRSARTLLERVEAYGREVGATHVFLETSNVNVPGIAAYERLGYELCGVDRLYYGAYMPGETAIYLAKMLDART